MKNQPPKTSGIDEEVGSAAKKATNHANTPQHKYNQDTSLAMKALNKETLRQQEQPFKTPEQISDEDYKVAPTSADKNIASTAAAGNSKSIPDSNHFLEYAYNYGNSLPNQLLSHYPRSLISHSVDRRVSCSSRQA